MLGRKTTAQKLTKCWTIQLTKRQTTKKHLQKSQYVYNETKKITFFHA